MVDTINVIIGYDEREAVAFHTCVQSIISNTSCHVNIIPLCLKNFSKYKENHEDGSNEFIYSRFLSPYLMNFEGWVLYLDGDMVCNADLNKLKQDAIDTQMKIFGQSGPSSSKKEGKNSKL